MRYELRPKYIFKWQKEFKLAKNTIIKPQVKIEFKDLGFEHLKLKRILDFKVLLLQKKNDILTFDNLTENWSLNLIIEEDTTIQIQIDYTWRRHYKKIHLMDWEEWLSEKPD